MEFSNQIQRRIVRNFGQPDLVLKIYDKLGDDRHLERLLEIIGKRRLYDLAFAGIAHIFNIPELGGTTADVQLYGRSNSENPEDVFPFSINLDKGEDLPNGYGRACLEETIMFGREAELYLKHRNVDPWSKEFAL